LDLLLVVWGFFFLNIRVRFLIGDSHCRSSERAGALPSQTTPMADGEPVAQGRVGGGRSASEINAYLLPSCGCACPLATRRPPQRPFSVRAGWP
jgi:hypothetical protein